MALPKKEQPVFVCTQCGFTSRKWLGQCPECDAWDTFEEQKQTQTLASRRNIDPPVPINSTVGPESARLVTSIGELDRVLGGGIVPGSLVLIGGDPGIGKSTLILQLLTAISKGGGENDKVLYVTGEESSRQIQMRAQRLAVEAPTLYVSTENCVESIAQMATEMQPLLLAIDSIQTMYSENVSSAPGSVTQVREGTARLLEVAKSRNIPTLLVGHVTKDGAIAGPRVLEHMVDTVLYFEGDRGQVFRILRTVKNRFGATNEIGVFEMKEQGLVEVCNPSALFLAERPVNVPGSVVMPSIEGSRPILVEVQALVSRSSPGNARRTAIGADPQRLALLTAVLEKKLGLTLYDQDIFLNIAGGIRIDEPALDLGMVVALLSSFFEKTVEPTTVVCGEVGLAGEIRAVGHMDMRIKEAARLGFKSFLLPMSCMKQIHEKDKKEIACIGVRTITDLADHLFLAG
ncbi:DNA repair protein RadA [Desulfogranum japonicum]|uniref:DNA repair protein RadA n=1 Tax=Desulfogranum japonicum TaxID=231447 RepID=UPI0004135463|nr:DNA repair protein RadA [Desulfogranum japonicum]